MKTIQSGVTGKAPSPDNEAELGGAPDIPFEHRDFGTAQLQQIFDCGKTTLFQDIIPELEIYYEGTRLKATGSSI